ncbi:VOC family protein [Halobacteriovorax sp. HLS]|uniref:VOC family protein n=1 Tax=Halobacteriovorax sp. HLS TaxID=2234000 RepID=UPI000FD6E596|nr:VOC family protein [Halobacteriovorax sp. HLS]
MKFLHSMIRVKNLDESLDFYVNKLGLIETRRSDYPQGKFSLIYLATSPGEPEVELTHNWEQQEEYSSGRNFGHLAFEVDDINESCKTLMDKGVTILRPPRDGYMAFIKCPDGISIELLQKGGAIEPMEPFVSMENTGTW